MHLSKRVIILGTTAKIAIFSQNANVVALIPAATVRPRLHETGTKSMRDDLVSVIVLFIIDVYMRPG